MNHQDLILLRGKRVFITGHTGFKGAWLSLWLHRLGAKVFGYSLAPAYSESIYEQTNLRSLIKDQLADICDYPTLLASLNAFEPEIVFHLAAQPIVRISYQNPKQTFDVNVGGTVNVLEAIRNSPSVRSVICVTSDKCYKNKEWVWGYRENDELGGRDPYSASKAASEMAFAAYANSFYSFPGSPGVASVRAGNVIGGGDWAPNRIVPDCIRALRSFEPIVLRNPKATRPWQHVLEPLSGYIQLALALETDPQRFGGSWNFGPESEGVYDVYSLAKGIAAEWGHGEIQQELDPNAPHEAGLLHLSIDKARFELGWKPRWTFLDTITQTTQWYRRVNDGESALDVMLRQLELYESGREPRTK